MQGSFFCSKHKKMEEKKIEIIYKKTEELQTYKRNPRINDSAVKPTANSIKEFGFKVPIVIDENNEIISGHTRLKAAKLLGLKEVPCIMAEDLDEEQKKAFRLADNKTAELAGWDLELLMDEMVRIQSIDMEQFGFQIEDMEDFALDLDDSGKNEAAEPTGKLAHCPKCGFVFEVE